METTELPNHLQLAVNMGVSGTDILHGELKNLMLEAEKEFLEAQQIEEDNDYSDAMESMERKYWEGQLDALSHVYALTYQLAFAISDRTKNNG
jgi:hypothetical protein